MNLLCGCVAVYLLANDFRENFDIAIYLVYAAAIFDFLDGFIARQLKVSSPIGKDLDSLADIVTFGLVPGFLLLGIMNRDWLSGDFVKGLMSDNFFDHPTFFEKARMYVIIFFPFITFLIPVFSALRLAKFNNDTRQTDSFIGLNTPSSTLFISSLVFINQKFVFYEITYLILIPLLCYLLVSEIPFFSLKFKSFGMKENFILYFFLVSSVILLFIFTFKAFAFIIPLYLLLSLINNFLNKKHQHINK